MALAVKTDFEVDERARVQRASELRARDYEAWLEDAKEGWRLIAKKRAALRSFVKKENDLDAVAGGGSRGISDAKRARFAALELTNVHALSRDEQKKSKKPKGGLTRWRLAKLDDLVLGEAATLQQAVRALARLRAREAEEEAEGVAPGSLLDEEDRMTRLELFSMGTRAGRREGNVDGDEDDDEEEDELERDDGMRGPGGGGAYGNLGVDDDVDDDDGGGGEKKTLRAQTLIFRDVLLRSRALESLATSYAMRAPADAVETSLLTEVFASLCAGGERVAAALARGVIEARPVACAGPPATAFAPRAPFLEDMPFLTFLPARASFLDSIPTHRDASRLHLTRPELRRPDATSLRAGKPPADFSRDVEARGDGAAEVRSIHWSPYDHVGVVNAVP
jgi:hypothetical protein